MNRNIWIGSYTPLLVLVLLLAVACRIYDLDYASLWADELWGVEACSRGSWLAMIDNLGHKDSHPPGYQTMLYYWMQLFGNSDFSVRLPSAIAGVAAVCGTYQFGARYFSPLMGVLAALCLALAHNAIFYSQEARAYAFLMYFTISHFYMFFTLFLRGQRGYREWGLFWLSGALLAYFHYVGVVVLLGEAMVLPFLLPVGARLMPWLRAFGPLLLLYVPWLPSMYQHLFHGDKSFETAVPGWPQLVETARFLWGPADLLFYTGLCAVVCLLVASARDRITRTFSDTHKQLLLLVVLSALPLIIFYVKSHLGSSAYTVRHFIYILPVVALVNAWFLERLLLWAQPKASVLTVGVVMTVIALVCIDTNTSDQLANGGKLYKNVWKIEYRQAVKIIAQDDEFMQNEKENVFISNLFFMHYLKKIGAGNPTAPFFHHDEPIKMPEYVSYIREHDIQNFYYLAVFMDVNTRAPSPLMIELTKKYHIVCTTTLFWTRIVKFSTQLPPNPDEQLHRCPRKSD